MKILLTNCPLAAISTNFPYRSFLLISFRIYIGQNKRATLWKSTLLNRCTSTFVALVLFSVKRASDRVDPSRSRTFYDLKSCCLKNTCFSKKCSKVKCKVQLVFKASLCNQWKGLRCLELMNIKSSSSSK